MARPHFVVIGNGPAGNQAALTLRDEAPEARITVVSRHRGGCYRPDMLPHLIAGEISEEALTVFSPGSYQEKDIKLRKGQAVADINLSKRELVLDHREVLSFDGLILAVGGKPRIPERLSVFEDLMITLKTLNDARIWIQKLRKSESIMMIGGDLTSLALTKQLIRMGKKVYFALDENAFWPLRLKESLREEVANKLTRKGVSVLKNVHLKGMNLLSDGSINVETEEAAICVGLIGAFFGLVPDIRFAVKSGLRIDRGILVDEYLHTGYDGVYATGDCAQIYHPDIRDYWVSIGHENAVVLGRLAARNLTGARERAEVAAESIFNIQGLNVNTSWWTEF